MDCLFKGNVIGGSKSTINNPDPFEDGSGIALYMLDGDATDESGVYNGTATSVTYGTGKFGQAGVFNTTDSRISTPSLPSVRSVSMYVNRLVTSTDIAILFDTRYTGTDDLYWGSSNTWGGIGITNLKVDLVSKVLGDVTPTNGEWHHIYFEISADYTGQCMISNYPSSFTYGFGGSIDQVRIFNRALTTDEITILYNERKV